MTFFVGFFGGLAVLALLCYLTEPPLFRDRERVLAEKEQRVDAEKWGDLRWLCVGVCIVSLAAALPLAAVSAEDLRNAPLADEATLPTYKAQERARPSAPPKTPKAVKHPPRPFCTGIDIGAGCVTSMPTQPAFPLPGVNGLYWSP